MSFQGFPRFRALGSPILQEKQERQERQERVSFIDFPSKTGSLAVRFGENGEKTRKDTFYCVFRVFWGFLQDLGPVRACSHKKWARRVCRPSFGDDPEGSQGHVGSLGGTSFGDVTPKGVPHGGTPPNRRP